MSAPSDRPPGPIRRVLRRLFAGARGREVLEDLDREYAARRERYPRAVAWGWYLLQPLRPDTWRLALALRRIRKAEGGASAAAGPRGDGRTLRSGVPLDLKLAWRMLWKSPGLTVVAVLGLALGTAVGVGAFVLLSGFFYPTLPLEEGDRIVALQNRDAEAADAIPPSLHDFLAWREEMRSVRPIAAASIGYRTLVTGDAAPRIVQAAEMTAAAFQVARISPLFGRYLIPEDEREGAARVAVLGYDLWQARFDGDPGVVGRRVLVGGLEHAVVGVMPPGFALPESEELWTALRTSPTRYERGDGPELFVFGRLAPGATPEQAQAELTAIDRRTAAAPGTNARLRPRILPYTHPLTNTHDLTLWEVARVQLMVHLLLIAIAVNVAVLVFARTAMRHGEIALRAALGASRRRIVGQLFVEALLLSTLGAGLGLATAYVILRQAKAIFEFEVFNRVDGIPFWLDYGLQPRSVMYAVALAILCAVIVGVVPGLKSTGRELDADLRRLGSGASVRLGWAWTALIVAQVAVAITVLPTALHVGFRQIKMSAVRTTFPAHEFLTAEVGLAVPVRDGIDGEEYRRETAARFADLLPELELRLEAEPAVVGATFEGRLAGRGPLVEVEGVPGRAASGAHRMASTGVAMDYFEVLGARILGGRELRARDIDGSGGGVVVNQAFVRTVLDGGSALGRRVRFLPESATGRSRPASGPGPDAEPVAPGPWLEIVGVVEDLEASAFDREWAPPFVYYAVAPGQLQFTELLVRVREGDLDGFAPRLREITAAVDPDLRLGSVGSLATMRNPRFFAVAVTVLQLVLGTVLLLSAAGIHALMSLAVTRRRREIGVRTALGARPARLLAAIFSRAAWQLGLGGLLGSLLGGALFLGGGLAGRQAAVFLCAVVVLMLTAGLIAAVGPARRGLGIQPMEALREE